MSGSHTGLQLLGPVEVLTPTGPLRFARAQHRDLLALLLLHHGRLLTLERTMDALWGGAAPPTAVAQVQNTVSALRSLLIGAQVPATVQRQPGGYLLQISAALIDAELFGSLCEQAAGTSHPDETVKLLRQALELWTGEPLGNVRAPFAAAARLDLTEQRTAALEALFEAELARGRHVEITAELAAEVRAHPFRERLLGQLMIALYRGGRRVEALQAYRDAARTMAEEHGLEPGPQLRDLELRLLREDASLQPDPPPATAATLPAAPPAPAAVPAQLPPAVYAFTGRQPELAALDGLLGLDSDGVVRPPGRPGVVAISAVSGAAGVGKTALAVHWAHRAAGAFPDGQLYLDLRGFDPDRPLEPAEALAFLLRGLGVAGVQVPYELPERAALYRSLLAGRRVLVLLDNAVDAEQVRPLLPGTPSCTVLVTSRDTLAGLVVRDGARRLDLDLLPAADAVALLGTLIGARVEQDPDAAALLAERCGRLPLALRIAAEQAVTRSGEPLGVLAGELADERHRLDLLRTGDDVRAAVRSVFSWSYRRLPGRAARLYRLLGLHPGSATDASAAVLEGAQSATGALDTLLRAHLIQPAGPAGGPRRFTMHDLLRAYAVELAGQQDAPEDRQAALGRLLDHYLWTAQAAVAVLYPAEWPDAEARQRAAFAAPPQALAWLDAERSTIAAITGYAGFPRHAVRLADALVRYLDVGGYRGTALRVHRNAVTAAQALGDRAAEAAALSRIGYVLWWWGRNTEATGYGEQALALYRQVGDRGGEANVLINLGGIAWMQGRFPESLQHLERALVLLRAAGDRPAVAKTLNNLGNIYGRTGQYARSIEHYQQAADLAAELGDRVVRARALDNLGIRHQRQGRYAQARQASEQALAEFVAMGDRIGEAHARDNLAVTLLSLGRFPDAEQELDRALSIFTEVGERDSLGQVTNNLGTAARLQGRYRQAVARHEQAVVLARQTENRSLEALAANELAITLRLRGDEPAAMDWHRIALDLSSRIDDPYEQARALAGIARGQLLAGDVGQAGEHWRQALSRFAALEVPEAEQVSAELAALGGQAASRR